MADESLQRVLDDARAGMRKAAEALGRDLGRIRTGRANPLLLEVVQVEYYGSHVPLTKLATVSAPEARLLLVQPFDRTTISDIERAILKADLGFTTVSDGKVVRVPIPELTEERRKQFVKQAKKLVEEHKVAVRGARREANEMLKTLEKDGDLSEDDARRAQAQVQQLTDDFIKKLDDAVAVKEKEILHI
jgi:ribosome recycling factor